jgi:hypothetical protein
MVSPLVIANHGVAYAYVWRKDHPVQDVEFFGSPNDSLQLGIMERPEGYVVKPHAHPVPRLPITTLSEYLHVVSGKIRVTVYDSHWQAIGTEELIEGDFLLLVRGGHQVEFLQPSRVIEVKQGPYDPDMQKIQPPPVPQQ